MKLVGIQIARPRDFGEAGATDPNDRQWTTGFYKESVTGSIQVGATNLAGDGQADLVNHGGVDKAICAYPRDHGDFWEAELGISLLDGAFGENFTTLGAVESEICIGDIFECGTALFQVSQPRQPCWKLARRWRIKDFAARVEKTGRTGWYFRVLSEGEVVVPGEFSLRERPHPEWTVAAANEVMHYRKSDKLAARSLAACPALSESWREMMAYRAA